MGTRASYRERYLRSASAAIASISLLFSFGCASVQLKNVDVRQARDYPYSQRASDLLIAADPYREGERVVETFGDDLVARGVFPILFVIENRSATQPFLIEKQNFRLLMEEAPEASRRGSGEAGTADDPSWEVAREAQGQYQGGQILSSLSPVMAVMLAPAMVKMQTDANLIIRHLGKMEMTDRVIFPGETCSGFIYFLLKGKETVHSVAGVQVKARNTMTNDPVMISVRIGKGR